MLHGRIIFLEIGSKVVPCYMLPYIQYSRYISNYNPSNVNSALLNLQASNKDSNASRHKIASNNFTTNTLR